MAEYMAMEDTRSSDDGSSRDSGDLTSQDKFNKPLKLDVSEKDWFLSSSQCQMGKLKELLTADHRFIDKKDFFATALHWAAKEGKSELLHWLCDAGADVNIKTGYTPLHIAVMHCRALIVDILISDYEADINSRDYSGKKPGHYVQSDMPTWVQRALRTNQKATEGLNVDALVKSTNANLAAMNKQPLSRSWNSFRYENQDEKIYMDGRDRDGVAKSRKKSILRSFRRIRNKDRMNHLKDQSSKGRESESRERHKSNERSKSVPDITLTPRSRKKLLQIEHPHFDVLKLPSSDIDVDIATKSSDSGGSSSEVDEVFHFNDIDNGCTKNSIVKSRIKQQSCDIPDDVSIRTRDTSKAIANVGVWPSDTANTDLSAGSKLSNSNYTATLMTDKNANQWKATTVV